jgi:hypothetical protein
MLLTNRTGASRASGDVVAFDISNDRGVGLVDEVGSLMPPLVARATISADADGEWGGRGQHVALKATGSIARGEYIRKSATSLTVQGTGVTMDASTAPPSGAVGIALAAAGGGVVTAMLFPHAWPALPSDLEEYVTVYEDFFSISSNASQTSGLQVSCAHQWRVQGPNTGLVASQSAWAGQIIYATKGASGAVATIWVPTLDPAVTVRWRGNGWGATGTHYIGLADSWTAAPGAGLYFVAQKNAQILARAHNGTSGTSLAMPSIASIGVFHTGTLMKVGATVIVVWDGVVIGTISSTLPTQDLALGGWAADGTNDEIEVDALYARQSR